MHRQALVCMSLLAILALPSCSKLNAPPSSGSQATTSVGAAGGSEGMPEATMVVTTEKGTRDDYETESIKAIANPTPAQIEEQVRAQDWKNAERRPSVGIGRVTTKATNRIVLKGVLGSADPELALRAEWTSDEDDQRVVRRSPPLESLDQGVELLKAWLGKDPNLPTMLQWSPVAN